MQNFLLSLSLSLLALTATARDGVALVIDPKSYTEARAEVDDYARAIREVDGRTTYIVQDHWGVPDSLRAALYDLYTQSDDPIVGAVLIGDIPVAMVRDGQHLTSAFKMIQTRPRIESSIPSDRFYDDFSLRFDYLDRDSVAPYFYYSLSAESAQRTRPSIYSGRIRPTDAGGTSRYDKLRAYLRKATLAKRQPRQVSQLFYFSGHGYISESKVARIDEKPAYFEHFPSLRSRTNAIGYMDYGDRNPVKEMLMNELMRPDLDVAVLHHHGAWDTQYLNEVERPYMVRDAKEYIVRNLRQHIYHAAQRGKDVDSVRLAMQAKFDVPASWTADALNDSLAVADSLMDASTDLYIEDFAGYGYQPNCCVVILDACYCGSFHRDDCIANEYIFQPGQTVAVLANTVNSLQDKWADRGLGLLNQGGCMGDMARLSTYLESHVIGDPTFRFATPTDAPDLDHLMARGKASDWRRLLRRGTPEQQALAIEMLHQQDAISSQELLQLYLSSPYGIVRLQTLRSIVDFRDDHTIDLLIAAADDDYELLQRLAVRYYGESGDERLIPALIRLSIANNTSARTTFDAGQALSSFPHDALMQEFARQFDSPRIQYLRRDSVRQVIAHVIEHHTSRVADELDKYLKTDADERERRFAIRATRNNMVHHKVPAMLDLLQTTDDEALQLLIIEALGWHPLSVQAPLIAQRMQQIQTDDRYSATVRREALKTLNRISGR